MVVATLHHFDATSTSTTTNTTTNTNNDGMDVDVDNDNNEQNEIIITSVEALGFAPKQVNPNWVASGGSDGTLKVWDLTHGVGQCRQICRVAGPSSESNDNDNDDPNPSFVSTGGITHLTWHPTHPIIFVSYADGVVRLWDARDGTIVHSLTGGGGGTSASTDNQINDFATTFRGVDTTNSGGMADVVTANDDGTVKVYQVDVQAVLMEAVAAKTVRMPI